jgi:uncharacterized protein (DUF433 family)
MVALEYPHITRRADGAACLERLPRVRVAQIATDHIGHGWSAEEILRQYPHLTAGEVHAALGFYFDHQEEIDREIEAEWREADAARKMTSSPLRLRLLTLRKNGAA